MSRSYRISTRFNEHGPIWINGLLELEYRDLKKPNSVHWEMREKLWPYPVFLTNGTFWLEELYQRHSFFLVFSLFSSGCCTSDLE